MQTKRCPQCGKDRPLSWFYLRGDESGRRRATCRWCGKERSRRWRASHPEVVARIYLRKNFKRQCRNHGITPHQFVVMFKRQRGRCRSCGDKFDLTVRHLIHIDHNHVTQEIRGLLCNGCNTAAGLLHDDPRRARKLAKYLASS